MSTAITGSVTFHGQPMTLIGLKMKEGDRARDVKLSNGDLSPVLPLEQSQGKVRLFITLPSLDTKVCAVETKKFSSAMREFSDSVSTYVVSADLPFAQNRWLAAEGIENMTLLSDYRNLDFARSWGLLIKELGLLTRAIYIVNRNGEVTYCEIVSEITSEPNYEQALAELQSLV